MSRILAINANTRVDATAEIARSCDPYVDPNDDVQYVNVAQGPAGIDSLLDVAISGLETARVVARRRNDFDAFVIACANDPGLDAAREVTDKPVVGIAEAGMHLASMLGATFSIVTFLPAEVQWMAELAVCYGLRSRLASTVTLGLTTSEVVTMEHGELLERVRDGSRRAVDEDKAEVVILAGSLMVGLAPPLTEQLGIPVISAMVCGLKMAAVLASLGLTTSRAHKYQLPEKSERLPGFPEFAHVYRDLRGGIESPLDTRSGASSTGNVDGKTL